VNPAHAIDPSGRSGAHGERPRQAHPRTVSPEQRRSLGRALDAAAIAPAPLHALTEHLAAVLAVDAAALTRVRSRWEISARSSSFPFPLAAVETALDALVEDEARPPLECAQAAGRVWTLLRLGHHYRPVTVFALEGDWTPASPFFALFASAIIRALSVARTSGRASQQRLAYRMTRRLGRAAGLPAVGDLIVRHMAHAVGARMATLSTPESDGRTLSIIASHGYARELVAHLRIPAGCGIVGGVYAMGQALHVRGLADRPGARRRPRYRTDSFIALPIRSGARVVGVVCVADRVDDEPFSRRDLMALRALAAPAAIALDRESARISAEFYAHAATIDPVTGAFNRRYFRVRLDEELQRSRRHDLPLAMLMIDIDDFKAINDGFGHLAGDAIISDVAEILRRSVRVFDMCARFGGEEFAIIMPGSDAADAARVAERIRQRIESYQPSDERFQPLRMTVSIGLATPNPDTPDGDLIERADRALYEAKRLGKNRVWPADPGGPGSAG